MTTMIVAGIMDLTIVTVTAAINKQINPGFD